MVFRQQPIFGGVFFQREWILINEFRRCHGLFYLTTFSLIVKEKIAFVESADDEEASVATY
jgi:hypothetical protein